MRSAMGLFRSNFVVLPVCDQKFITKKGSPLSKTSRSIPARFNISIRSAFCSKPKPTALYDNSPLILCRTFQCPEILSRFQDRGSPSPHFPRTWNTAAPSQHKQPCRRGSADMNDNFRTVKYQEYLDFWKTNQHQCELVLVGLPSHSTRFGDPDRWCEGRIQISLSILLHPDNLMHSTRHVSTFQTSDGEVGRSLGYSKCGVPCS
jgi:hypothetical protein